MQNSQILVVEDEGLVALSIKSELEDFGYHVTGIASTASEAIEKVNSTRPDLILMDIHLSGSDDGVLVAKMIQETSGTPIIFLSAFSDPDTIARASLTNAYGYLLKPYEEHELHTTIEMALAKHVAEQQLAESERWFAAIHHGLSESVITVDPQLNVRFMNESAELLTGWKSKDAVGTPVSQVCSFGNQSPVKTGEILEVALKSNRTVHLPTSLTMSGSSIPVEGTVSPISDKHGKRLGAAIVLRDVTDRLETEELKLQSEDRRHRAKRLDAINRIAGILANRLEGFVSTIHSNVSKVFNSTATTEPNRILLHDAIVSSHRALEMIQRLKLFSTLSERFGTQSQVIRVEDLFPSFKREIESKIEAHTELSIKICDSPWPVMADELILRRAIVELAVNASEAMPHDGKLNIEVENISIEKGADHPETPSGDFLRIRMHDNGKGMKPTSLDIRFDPLATDTDANRDAGIGLTFVYSAMKQMQGWVDIGNSLNMGAQIDLYLPRCETEATLRGHFMSTYKPISGKTILFCDSDSLGREEGVRILSSHRFHVLTAEDGMEAARIFEHSQSPIDVLILDLDMPKLSAYAVLQRLIESDPNVRVLFSGGYFSETMKRGDGHVLGVIAKPYRENDLLELIRLALATPCHSSHYR